MKYGSSILDGLKNMAYVKVFVHTSNTDKDAYARTMTLVSRTFIPSSLKMQSASKCGQTDTTRGPKGHISCT